MVLHCAAFSESAARASLAAGGITPCGPDPLEPIGTIDGDYLVLSRPTNLLAAVCISEAEANTVSWRFKRSTQNNYNTFFNLIKQDDGDLEPIFNQMLGGGLVFPLKANDRLHADANNGNNAQLETLIMLMGGAGDLSPLPLPYSKVVHGLGGGTLTVDIWTDCGAMVWTEEFEADTIYQIVGASFWSATGHAGRLNLQANKIFAKPGTIAGTTALAGNHIVWGNLGSFKGVSPPAVEMLANTADTAENVTLFLR